MRAEPGLLRRTAAQALTALALALALALPAPAQLPRPVAAAEAQSPAAAAPHRPLLLAVYPYVESGLLTRRMQPLADYFNRQVPGLALELRVLPREALQAAIEANQVDLVLTNPSHYLELRSRNALTGALATLVRRHGMQSTSSAGGAIVVRVDAPLSTLSDLRGQRVAAPRGKGLASYQAQAFELRRVGIDVAEDTRLLLVRGQREATRAVIEGEADVAFVRAGFIDDVEAMGGLDPQRLKVLNAQRLAGYPFAVSTRLYPEWPLLALPHVDRTVVRRIAAAALALDEDHPAARAAGIAGFDPPADYLPVEQLARAMRAPPFDQAPTVRLRDVLDQHRYVVVATAAGLLTSAALLVLLLRRNAQLRRGNHELARSRGLLQTVLDTVPVQVFWKDRQGRVLGRNAAAEAHAQPATAQAEDQTALESAVLASGQAQLGVESPWQRPDGNRGWRRSSVVPLRDLDGSVIGVLGTHDDVSALREQQQAVLEAHNRLQATLDALPDLLFEIDRNGTYHFAHSPVAGLLAAPLEALVGRNIADVLPADVVQLCHDLMARCGQQGFCHGERYKLDLPVGERWFEASMAPKAGGEGAVPHFVMIVRDVTERRAAELELEAHRERLQELVAERTAELSAARDAAEQASRAKSAFLANTSHEIRTPLNAVIGMAQLLRRSPLNAQQTAWLNALQNAGEHLLEVLNAILDLSKIEAGKLTLAPERTDLRALVANVRSMVSQRATDKGLALQVDLPDRLPPVLADTTRLQQALLNLVHNAIKFTEHGRILIRLRELGGHDEELTLRFEVDDTGIGVEPDVMPRLFKAFEQADNSASRHYGGTGLGLAITARLAQLMGGETGASSTPGQGSRFWFTVRLRRLADVVHERADPAAVALLEERLRRERPGRRVLVVDDDPINRELATELIRAAGQQVTAAADGEEALDLLGRDTVDLVLMDMQMPRLDGLATTRRIRAAADGPGPPIIALTANAFSEDRARCLAAGMNDFLAKPLNLAELHTALWRWLP